MIDPFREVLDKLKAEDCELLIIPNESGFMFCVRKYFKNRVSHETQVFTEQFLEFSTARDRMISAKLLEMVDSVKRIMTE